jgi:hypothetical protein
MLPDFLLGGAAKGGTTALAEMIGEHPEVFVADRKESHFMLFDGQAPAFFGPGDDELVRDFIITARDEYERLFERAGSAKAVGEASVFYLYRPESFVHARELIGDRLKVVLVLRDPAARAFSGHAHLVRDGREELSFAEALECEDDRVAAGWEYIWHHRRLGAYHRQVQALYDAVGSERVLILRHEDLVDDPVGTCGRTFEFLGVDASFRPTWIPFQNPGGRPRSRTIVRLMHHATLARPVARALIPGPVRRQLRERIVRWNLREIDDEQHGRDRLRRALADDARETARLTGLDLGAWQPNGLHPR